MPHSSERNMFFRALTLAFKIEHDKDEWEYTEEPHTSRRQEILKRHPEIKKLMGNDSTIAYYVVLEVTIQLILCKLVQIFNPSWVPLVILTWVVSGTLNHSLGSAIHEIGHNLAFGHKRGWANRVLSLVANIPIAIPMAISYKKYHGDHHRWLGHDTYDVDIPTVIESYLFRNPLTKTIWIIINPIIHAVRPFMKSPRPITYWEATNFVTQGIVCYLVYQFFGFKPLFYLSVGTILGLGLHPLSGHFISEHYLWGNNNMATHSYYGPLNGIMFNLGYHVEHHDFPYIPNTRLHLVSKIAPEFYEDLNYHTSWVKVIWTFIMDYKAGPHARSVTAQNISHPELYDGMRVKLATDEHLQQTVEKMKHVNGNGSLDSTKVKKEL